MSDQTNREKEIFERALDLDSPEGRLNLLEKECGTDRDLLSRVKALLQANETGDNFLPENSQRQPTPVLDIEKVGDRIGRYKLLQKIGEGGCGVVYMAEQEEPIRRRVALKVIKIGMDTKSVIARFDAERQALALMDHPNIAKVLDAGATENGRPFFVMELVRGLKITEYCDRHRLPAQQRLRLFIQVCNAVQHAHQKGIIHRDIKPSNILVSWQDNAPVPKVIDFGIAKATQGRLTNQTLFTAFEQFIGTPAYMSPEQAEMSAMDIDTRSDIYSLGVLLYELLTGETPFDAKKLIESGLDEMRRIIREKEPLRPSTRLHTMQAWTLTQVAQHRQAEALKLVHLVRGDLDWIVMKALEKDRARRYETANGLVSDIQRHLNNEPVSARPPSRIYQFQKMVRRNKLSVAAVGSVTLALVIGLGISTWLFTKEKEARQRAVAAEREQNVLRQKAEANEQKARTEAAKHKQAAAFWAKILDTVGPSTAKGRDTTLMREVLDKTADLVDKDLKNQPEVAADLLSTISFSYVRLGEFEKGEVAAREALRLRQSLFGDTNELTAQSLSDLARVLARRGSSNDLTDAETLLRKSAEIQTKLGKDQTAEFGSTLALLAGTLKLEQKLGEAETLSLQALELRKKLDGPESSEVPSSLLNLGLILRDENQLTKAEATIRQALEVQQRKFTNDPLGIITSMDYLATVLQRENKLSEAETTFREGMALLKKTFGTTNRNTAAFLIRLGDLLQPQNRLSEAEALYRESLSLHQIFYPAADSKTESVRYKLASVLMAEKKFSEAESNFLSLCQESSNDGKLKFQVKTNGSRFKSAAKSLAQLYEATGQTNEAAQWKSKIP